MGDDAEAQSVVQDDEAARGQLVDMGRRHRSKKVSASMAGAAASTSARVRGVSTPPGMVASTSGG